jgi:hypothetical protein
MPRFTFAARGDSVRRELTALTSSLQANLVFNALSALRETKRPPLVADGKCLGLLVCEILEPGPDGSSARIIDSSSAPAYVLRPIWRSRCA